MKKDNSTSRNSSKLTLKDFLPEIALAFSAFSCGVTVTCLFFRIFFI